MKHFKLLAALVALITVSSLSFSAQGANAIITQSYLQHNQYVNNQKVMYVRYSFDTYGVRGQNIKAEVTLYKSNGKPIYGYNGAKMSNTQTLYAGYDRTIFNNYWAWFAINAMNLPRGRNNCYALIRIISSSGKLLGKSQKLTFYLDKN